MFYYLYHFSALYDRSIVGWEVYEEESADYAGNPVPTWYHTIQQPTTCK